jgi:hypothetical protein
MLWNNKKLYSFPLLQMKNRTARKRNLYSYMNPCVWAWAVWLYNIGDQNKVGLKD